jgi:hypothetical protein
MLPSSRPWAPRLGAARAASPRTKREGRPASIPTALASGLRAAWFLSGAATPKHEAPPSGNRGGALAGEPGIVEAGPTAKRLAVRLVNMATAARVPAAFLLGCEYRNAAASQIVEQPDVKTLALHLQGPASVRTGLERGLPMGDAPSTKRENNCRPIRRLKTTSL